VPLEAGSTIGDYKILASLGAGGMGRVYKVQNLITNRTEAIKVLLPDLTEQPGLAERFVREIQVQARLVHPNITALHTALRLDNQLVMVMEMVEGETLERKLRAGRLPVDVCAGYARQILGALAYAHEREVIHRDIKPSNVMVAPDGTAKLMDFGLAAAVGTDKRLTKTGAVLGSLYYMPPEQVKGEPPTERSDIYSFGLTLYEMLTGVRAIQGDSEYAIMTAHLMSAPHPPSKLQPDIPANLSEVVMRSIAKDPGKRIHSAAAFLTALNNCWDLSATRTMIGSSGIALSAQHTALAAARARRRRNLLIGGTTAAAAILVAGAGVYWVSSPSSAPAPQPGVAAVDTASRAPVAAAAPSPSAAPEPAPTVAAATPEPPVKKPAPSSAKAFVAPPVQRTPAPPPAQQTPAPSPPSRPAEPEAANPPLSTQPASPQPVIPEPPPLAGAPPPAAAAPIPAAPPKIAAKSAQQLEAEEWEAIRNSRDLAKLGEFRRKYPNSAQAQQALALMADIEWDQIRQSRDPKTLRGFQSRYSGTPRAAEAGIAADRIEIASVLTRYEGAYAARNIGQVRALWPGNSDATGKIEQFFKLTRSAKLTLRPSADPAIAGDRAVVQCRYTLAAEFTDGSKQPPRDGNAVLRITRADGAWVIEQIEYQ
jgi:eukaryotic-like serine/threonine-protein kinase